MGVPKTVVILACQENTHNYSRGCQVAETLHITQSVHGLPLIQCILETIDSLEQITSIKQVVVVGPPEHALTVLKLMKNIRGDDIDSDTEYDEVTCVSKEIDSLHIGNRGESSAEDIDRYSVHYIAQSDTCGGAKCDAKALALVRDKGLFINKCVLVLSPNFPLVTSSSLDMLSDHHADERTESKDHMCTILVKDAKKMLPVPSSDRYIACVEWDNMQSLLREYLALSDPAQWWYYVRQQAMQHVEYVNVRDESEVREVNSFRSLALATKVMRANNNNMHMDNGVYIIDPDTTHIEAGVSIRPKTTILPNTHIKAGTRIGEGSEIGPNSILERATIGKNTQVRFSVISESEIGDNCTVGPYAHLRNSVCVADECRLGNFVELKNTSVGTGTCVAHLTYLGDAKVGKEVNFGAGTITANYDGKDKHGTVIGDGSKTGANCVLVAPLQIGKQVVIAASTTVTKDVEDGCLVIGRVRAESKPGYKASWARGDVQPSA
ncbi:hypothetical protein SARC_00838 [Sphaeroforma arctica JP610]|uniref:Uncharacterized protein n=1 Tax=Sphaeroforma arctica JP610 TaxID=667725 RepID=A0A0L0GFH2_9EUKA|nr:hypothetical protein SARC_00838 [Sphaeroforma arctica JP610]KNC87028.1 hypothetical protein SARC_00838 [Sphaeroforma arctica JP610]|eukprot:XP_014160930.1 hypothetical protein SARC_00838 [Sphaeroforma arctica JP610]